MINNYCPVCNSVLDIGLQAWHFECATCGYEKADFKPLINENYAHEQINEEFRKNGLRSLRIKNFNKLLSTIRANSPSSISLLDVGCAHGWFLEAAKEKGFDVLGIEPDINIYQATKQRDMPVRNGFFPNVLSGNELFDVIIFNDVFEHIPDVNNVLAGCRDHLKKGGVLVLNMPSSSGIFYIISRLLCRFKVVGFFERLWQKGLPSPHLHYFRKNNLNMLLQTNGFDVVKTGELSSIIIKGLFTRISYAGNQALVLRLFIYIIVCFSMPIIWAMPGDIFYSLSKKR